MNHTRKVKVFISSNCDTSADRERGIEKYGVMRRSLKCLLDETGICEAVVVEMEMASSSNVDDYYIEELDSSDLAVVIIDNRDGVKDGTQEEINRIRANDKKAIYIFCNEREKESTELEKTLKKDRHNPKFYPAPLFADIPRIAYNSVIDDILRMYKKHCRGKMEPFDEEQKGTESLENKTIDVPDFYSVSSDYLDAFTYTKYMLKKEVGTVFGDEKIEIGRDYNMACLLGLVLGSSETQKPNFDEIKQILKATHTGNMQKIVLSRYQAIEAYFSGDYCLSKKKLIELAEFIKTKNKIPKWIYNDVALDLRTCEIEDNTYKSVIFSSNLQGQGLLEENEEPLYYPIIDRFVSEIKDEIHRIKQINSYYDINRLLEKICNVFIVASFYGSLTHMLIVRKRLYDCISVLSISLRDHRLFMLSVRLLLLLLDAKELKKYLDTYGENTNSISGMDVAGLLRVIDLFPVKQKQTHSRELLYRFFGYYYSEELFNQESRLLFESMKETMILGNGSLVLPMPFFDALTDNIYRIDTIKLLEFTYWVFSNNITRFYDELFKVLSVAQFDNIPIDDQKRYQAFLVCQINAYANEDHSNLFRAAINLRRQETIPHISIDQTIRDNDITYYEIIYRANVEKVDEKEGWQITKKYIELIDTDNQTQGKNGIYHMGAYDPFVGLTVLIKKNELKYKSDQLKDLIRVIKDTLLSETQTLEAKGKALELLIVLQLSQPRNKQIINIWDELINYNESVSFGKTFVIYKGYNKTNITLLILLLGFFLRKKVDVVLGKTLVEMQNAEPAVRIKTLNFLEFILEYESQMYSGERFGIIFQYILHESYSSNSNIRFRAVAALTKVKNALYSELCLEKFSEIMDKGSYQVKVGILCRFKKEDLNNPAIRYLFDRGKTDTHYWVRTIAKRFEDER